jgi:hypothetical protein
MYFIFASKLNLRKSLKILGTSNKPREHIPRCLYVYDSHIKSDLKFHIIACFGIVSIFPCFLHHYCAPHPHLYLGHTKPTYNHIPLTLPSLSRFFTLVFLREVHNTPTEGAQVRGRGLPVPTTMRPSMHVAWHLTAPLLSIHCLFW